MRDSKWWQQRYGGPPPTPAVLVCTGRGEHKRVVLLGVMVYTHSGLVELADRHYAPRVTGSGRLDVGEPAGALRYVRVARTREQNQEALSDAAAWEFSCPRCPRATPRVRKELIAAAVRQGNVELDVSQ